MSRAKPADLRPVISRGLRYGQDWLHPGRLYAYDERSAETVWEMQLYPNHQVAGLEADVQAVYFTRMELAQNGKVLLIENEKKEVFQVDLERRIVLS